MKTLIRQLLFNALSIYAITLLNPGFNYSGGYKTLFLAALVLLFIHFVLRPVLSIIFIPINFLTLGIFSWVLSLALFYALIYFVPAIHVSGWLFEGYHLKLSNFNFDIPHYQFNFITNIILVSFLFNLFNSILQWLVD